MAFGPCYTSDAKKKKKGGLQNDAPERENSVAFEVLPSVLLPGKRMLFLGKVKYKVQLSWPLISFNAGAVEERMGGFIAPYSLRVLVRPTSWHTRR